MSRVRMTADVGFAIASFVAAVVTLLMPTWIEAVVGVDPDAGSGAAELGVVLALVFAAAACARDAWRLHVRHAGV